MTPAVLNITTVSGEKVPDLRGDEWRDRLEEFFGGPGAPPTKTKARRLSESSLSLRCLALLPLYRTTFPSSVTVFALRLSEVSSVYAI